MSGPQARALLARLSEISGNRTRDYSEGIRLRHQNCARVHKVLGTCPGEDYIFVGNSYNLENSLVGTELAARRISIIAMMMERRGNRNRCVHVDEAFAYEGFPEVLSRFEFDMLSRLGNEFVLGPAFDRAGSPLPAAFCIWRATSPVRQGGRERELVLA